MFSSVQKTYQQIEALKGDPAKLDAAATHWMNFLFIRKVKLLNHRNILPIFSQHNSIPLLKGKICHG